MKSAKTMFEELGYKLEKDNEEEINYHKYEKDDMEVVMLEELKKANEYITNNMPSELFIIKNVLDQKINEEMKNEIHKKLSQYKNMKREISELKHKYMQLEEKATKITALTGDGIHTLSISDKVGNAANMAELMKQIEHNIELVEKNIIEIEKFVYEIEDVEIREIIRYRFINGLSWQQVALKMNWYDEANPRMRYNRWLRKII